MLPIQERATALSDQDLLPSQRVLLSTEVVGLVDGFSFTFIHGDKKHELGQIFAYDLSLAQEARDIVDYTDRDGNFLSAIYSKAKLRELNRVAIELIDLNDTAVSISSTETFGEYENGVYTPTGIVEDIDGVLKQKGLKVEMTTFHKFGGGPTERILQLYTDNLTARPPLWEFKNSRHSDITPNGFPREYDPLYGHYPQGFESEELAFATIDSLRRVLSRP